LLKTGTNDRLVFGEEGGGAKKNAKIGELLGKQEKFQEYLQFLQLAMGEGRAERSVPDL
jgi:hypothetical protein